MLASVWSVSCSMRADAASGSRCIEVVGGLELHQRGGEGRAQTVVQVATEPPPLLLTRSDQPLPGPLQLPVAQQDLHQGTHLGAEVLEQSPVARAERLSHGADLHQELPDRGARHFQHDGRRFCAALAQLGEQGFRAWSLTSGCRRS